MLDRLPDPARRAIRTFVQSFVALFAVSVMGWLKLVVDWADAGGAEPFPGVSALGYAAIAAASSAAIAVVTYVQNLLEDRGKVRDLR